MLDDSDMEQLLKASVQGRCIVTFGMRGGAVLAGHYPHHADIILAAQSRWTFGELIAALDRALSETEDDAWRGQVRWLNQWRY